MTSMVAKEHSAGQGPRPIDVALLASVFVIAACGLLYELAAGALASYLLGDSVLQFSTIIGTYLFAMGIGSWLSRYFEDQLPAHFLRVELMVALVGGALPAVLFLANAYAPGAFRFLLYGMVMVVGTLVGLEIPLVMRILKRNASLKDLVSKVLTFDYLGALAVSLAFPIVLVPKLGLVRTGLLFGFMNAAIAVWALVLFKHELRNLRAHSWACALVLLALGGGIAGADQLTRLADDHFYQDRIVLSSSSPYQRIVVTQGRQGARLYLNGNLQFAQSDEYRYHEALVHPAMAAHGAPKKVAVLGGGDGMAVREVLKYPGVESVVLVELDPAMTDLFKSNAMMTALNGNALNDARVSIVNTDAFHWLQQSAETFDVIVVDFPDPTNFAIGKLFTNSFYSLLDKRLAASGYAVIQTTSPLIARQSFWTVVQTVESVALTARPYHVHVPSFGEWGFVLASHRPWREPEALPAGMRFLTLPTLRLMFDFPLDMARVPTEVNRLSNQVLVNTYEREWGKVEH
ncbi:spermidine synthase [Comamonas testosteroni]|uniref:Polyamine aminopropyltransferase n=1 Tax=Comamonas testosteroni TaxID=285 RepID=A0A096FHG9_COMTE|nr:MULTISPECIES: polyamine aminopropyltransferase [Comamonas]KGH29424.1 spermidine synthase [Comamonas testosteroni]KOC24089.1 spermidine synthase [Comamonas testosteroni]KWT67619.1 Spermidine synthase [Comamonas testosteroni]MPT11057.1 polyamine aminopropyltransferase [Comamonas sp.]